MAGTTPPAGRRAGGFTLIELMIALAVAMFLIAGMVTLEQGMRNTFGNQNGLAQLQDEERFALNILGQVAQEAGYYPDPTSNVAANVFPASGGLWSIAGQSIAGTSSDVAPGDTLAVRFVASGTTVANANFDPIANINCIGQTNGVATQVLYTNVFSVDAATNTLRCTPDGGITGPFDLVHDVTNMRVWYGVKTNPAVATNNPDVYLRASDVAASNLWPNVTSLRVILTFKNPLANQPGQPATVQLSRVTAVMQRTGMQL